MEALEAVSGMQIVSETLQAETSRFDTSVFAQRMSEFVSQTMEKHRRIYRRRSGHPL